MFRIPTRRDRRSAPNACGPCRPAPHRPRGRGRRLRHAAAAAAAAGALAACTTLPRTPPEYVGAVETDQPLLIVIPGLLASRLADADTGRRVWPPNLAMLILGWRTRDLALPPEHQGNLDKALSATGIVLSRPRRDYYSGLLDALTAAGYECRSQHDFDAGTNCLLFAWDWRLGFVEAAAELADVVARIQAERGEPHAPIDVVGHSAGAMIARYYARHGGRDLDGVRRPAGGTGSGAPPDVRRMILIGPPNRGSIFGAYALMHGYPLGFFTVHPEVLATFDTSYQLLPHPERPWAVDVRGEHAGLDIYSVETWRRFELSIFDPDVRARALAKLDPGTDAETYLAALERRFAAGLERGRRFHDALSAVEPAAAGQIEYLVVASDCARTPRYFLTDPSANSAVLNLDPAAVDGRLPDVDYESLLLAPGDGRVTQDSALPLDGHGAVAGPPAISFDIVCARHSEMTANARVQRQLLAFLLGAQRGVTAAARAGP